MTALRGRTLALLAVLGCGAEGLLEAGFEAVGVETLGVEEVGLLGVDVLAGPLGVEVLAGLWGVEVLAGSVLEGSVLAGWL